MASLLEDIVGENSNNQLRGGQTWIHQARCLLEIALASFPTKEGRKFSSLLSSMFLITWLKVAWKPSRLHSVDGYGELELVNFGKKEATPIARLRDANDRTTGWVYHWNTSELAILWIYKDRMAKRIAPPLSPETLAKAKAVTADSAIDLLEALSAGGQKKLE